MDRMTKGNVLREALMPVFDSMSLALRTAVNAGRCVDDGTLQCCDALGVGFRAYLHYFAECATVAEVDIAIRFQELVLQHSDDHGSNKRFRVQELGALFAARSQLSGAFRELRSQDLDDAITWHRHAIELLPGNPTNAAYLTCLGLLFWTRFHRSDELADLEDAVASWGHAVELLAELALATPPGTDMGFFASFETVRRSGLLAQTVAALRRKPRRPSDHREEALSTLPTLAYTLRPYIRPSKVIGDIHRFQRGLYTYLRIRCQWPADTEHIDDAIAATSCIVALSQGADLESDMRKAALLYNLSIQLTRRFHRDRSYSDLETSIGHLDCAFETLEPFFVSELRALPSVAIAINEGITYLPTGETFSKCCRLVTAAHNVIRRIPEWDQHGKALCLSAVASLYNTRFLRCGDTTDIDTATAMHRDALRLFKSPTVIDRLCSSLYARYIHFRVDADVNEAIKLLHEAIPLASRDSDFDTLRIARLHDKLADFYDFRYEDYHQPSDADASAEERSRATTLAPDAFPSATAEISEGNFPLSMAIQQIHDQTPHASHRLASFTGPDVTSRYLSLARRLASRYTRSRIPADRELAVAAFRGAIDASNDFTKLPLLNELCTKLREWDWSSRPATDENSGLSDLELLTRVATRPEALREEIELNSEGLKLRGPIVDAYNCMLHRVILCQLWRIGVQHFGDPLGGYGIVDVDGEEIAACQRLIDLMPQVVSQGYSITRRYKEMARLGYIVRYVVNAAARLRDPIALEWFEHGRSLVWGQIRNLRARMGDEEHASLDESSIEDGGDASLLRQKLAQELKRVSEALEAASRDQDAVVARRLESQREGILQQIRSLPGLHKFLEPMDVMFITMLCYRSQVVCINDSMGMNLVALIPRMRTYFHEQNVLVVDLPVQRSSVDGWRQRLNLAMDLQPARTRKSKAANVRRDRSDTRRIMRELWDCIVRPIFEALDICTDVFPPDGVDLPWITWCTTGALAFLPLHAAGPYDSQSPNAFDLVVSSYTPNIRSLYSDTNSRAKPKSRNSRPNILVVAQPETAGLSPLPGTLEEADTVENLFRGSCVRLDGPEGTVGRVFAEIGTHEYVHLACHGEQDSEDPLKSSFALHDGALTLDRLMELAHSPDSVGEVAFLSACETATGDEKVPDEAVHLAAGMLAVGYRSVIATMWSIGDNQAPMVASEFYNILLKQYDKDGKTDVPRALHAAVAMLRTKVRADQIEKWAPFVHFGV